MEDYDRSVIGLVSACLRIEGVDDYREELCRLRLTVEEPWLKQVKDAIFLFWEADPSVLISELRQSAVGVWSQYKSHDTAVLSDSQSCFIKNRAQRQPLIII